MIWYAAHQQVSYTIVGRHHPEWLKLPSDATEPVIRFWLEWYERHGTLPPGLVTSEGVIVDGNHRFEACRRLNVSMWCCLVRPAQCVWAATGGVALVGH